MSKKRDPLAVIINYFTTTDLVQANQAVTIIKEIVRSRQPVAAPRKSAPHRKRAGLPTQLPLDSPGTAGAQTAN